MVLRSGIEGIEGAEGAKGAVVASGDLGAACSLAEGTLAVETRAAAEETTLRGCCAC